MRHHLLHIGIIIDSGYFVGVRQLLAHIDEVTSIILVFFGLRCLIIKNKLSVLETQEWLYEVERTRLGAAIRDGKVVSTRLEYTLSLLQHLCNFHESIISAK